MKEPNVIWFLTLKKLRSNDSPIAVSTAATANKIVAINKPYKSLPQD